MSQVGSGLALLLGIILFKSTSSEIFYPDSNYVLQPCIHEFQASDEIHCSFICIQVPNPCQSYCNGFLYSNGSCKIGFVKSTTTPDASSIRTSHVEAQVLNNVTVFSKVLLVGSHGTPEMIDIKNSTFHCDLNSLPSYHHTTSRGLIMSQNLVLLCVSSLYRKTCYSLQDDQTWSDPEELLIRGKI